MIKLVFFGKILRNFVMYISEELAQAAALRIGWCGGVLEGCCLDTFE